MSQPLHDVVHSFEDYVVFEGGSNVKHEFLGGHIYARAGGTPEHAALAASVTGFLIAQLGDGPCRAHSSDLRVRAGDLVTYPDVTVVCGQLESDPRDSSTTLNPTRVVEVTSPSTERYDRGEKLEHYQRIESLRAVVLVAHDEPRRSVWLRGPAGWETKVAGPWEGIELPGIGATLSVRELYARAGLA
jgi:Uma2 family endonuclease